MSSCKIVVKYSNSKNKKRFVQEKYRFVSILYFKSSWDPWDVSPDPVGTPDSESGTTEIYQS